MNPTDDEIRALMDAEELARGEAARERNSQAHKILLTRLDDIVEQLKEVAARPLAEEVLRLRKLLVDIDKRGVGHNSMCEGGWKGKPCPCGADELQLRINEATQ